jgi:TolA-binding protein
MFDTANYQIRFGEFGAAKRTLHTLIRQYPNLEITESAKKRLNALESR